MSPDGDIVAGHGKRSERIMQALQCSKAGYRGRQLVGHDEERNQTSFQHTGNTGTEFKVG